MEDFTKADGNETSLSFSLFATLLEKKSRPRLFQVTSEDEKNQERNEKDIERLPIYVFLHKRDR